MISKYNSNFDTDWTYGISMHFRVKISTLPNGTTTRIIMLTDKKVPAKNPEQMKRKLFSLDISLAENNAQIIVQFELGNIQKLTPKTSYGFL